MKHFALISLMLLIISTLCLTDLAKERDTLHNFNDNEALHIVRSTVENNDI
jgi:hypothetical protein